MHFYGYFQTDVLINYFIPFRRAETITWKNFVPAGIPAVQKRDPSCRHESFYMLSQDLIYEEFITLQEKCGMF